MFCPYCKQEFEFRIGDIWINEQGYKTEIMDWGTQDIWLFYEENRNKCAWKIIDFLKEYKKLNV